jgi:DNA-binding CsgD family transcriptional regulator
VTTGSRDALSLAALAWSAEDLGCRFGRLSVVLRQATGELSSLAAECAALARAARSHAETARPNAAGADLTRQELRVVCLVMAGHTNVEIGRALNLGRETVKSHLASTFRKLGVHGRTELRVRIGPPPEWGKPSPFSPTGGLQS